MASFLFWLLFLSTLFVGWLSLLGHPTISSHNSKVQAMACFFHLCIGGMDKEPSPYPSIIEGAADMAAVGRPDRDGTHRKAFERNKKLIYATRTVCGICGKPVDFSIKAPHPMSACIDHIIPVDKGGHPSDIENLQLAHRCCNGAKSDKLFTNKEKIIPSNRLLPQSKNWKVYKAKD